MRIVFFGPPGSGKGTQAERVSEHFGLVHISTGMLLREEIRSGSEMGKLIRETVESGRLVSDEIVNLEVFRRLGGIDDFLLDGYPRNASQAESLDAFLDEAGRPLSGAVFLSIPDEEAVRRLTERLVCACADGSVHGEGSEEGDACPHCGESLVRRTDDDLEVVSDRLRHYHELTGRLEDYYRDRLLEVDGTGTREQVFDRIRTALDEWA